MSRKRREQRDHKKGIKTTVRVGVTSIYEDNKDQIINVDCGGWPSEFVANLLITAGRKLREKEKEPNYAIRRELAFLGINYETTESIREDTTTAEVKRGSTADTRESNTGSLETTYSNRNSTEEQ